ncbi:translocation/assembly module TamB domain-containing protein [Shimia abyssi]|uniref:Autotransporter secretion inner membrane protein TamB n=1 Tax=Shimia abyssi TaxID=1662395 RepID=A0A2P8EX47_9RHOB|nr:translocation/assembly module TamB domain-containing protein [Shimia abyssi]PSL14049.1 autotransporter secretion inner membrane protein TamB [Shimia abyssi]
MRWFALIMLLAAPTNLVAQEEDDKGMLTRFLESSLSGAGRVVEVDGLRGAISSEATIEEIRISDDEGLWLTVSGIKLNWSRLAVLKGNINVNELSAERISIVRAPKSEPTPEAPTAEAKPFSLPELPVSVNIQKLSSDRIELGETLLGQELAMSLETKLVLLEGNGDVVLKATRLEGPEGKFHLDAAFSNETRQLRINLDAREDANGIVANLTRLPGAPAIDLSVKGDGPIDSFTADLKLASAGQERLAGQVVLSTEAALTPDTAPTRVIKADISGDMAPLFAPEYRDFFGDKIGLETQAHIFADGRTILDGLSLTSAVLDLQGNAAIAADGLPDSFDVTLNMADPDGDPILLPVSGAQTFLKSADLEADFDASEGERWTLSGTVEGFQSESVDLGWLTIAGQGLIHAQDPRHVSASVTLDTRGVVLSDAALAQAVGESGTLSTDLFWHENEGLQLTEFDFQAAGIQAEGNANFSGLGGDLAVSGAARVLSSDISRFSGLAGRDLGGEILAHVDGSFAALTGAFDVDLQTTGRDLSIDDPRFDNLVTGETKLTLSAARDFEKLDLRNFELDTEGLDATASGTLDSSNGQMQLSATLHETSDIMDGLSGPTSVKGSAKLTNGDWTLDLDTTAPGNITAAVDATVPKNAMISASFDMTVGNVEIFLPALPGSAEIHADVAQTGAGWNVDLDGSGPFETSVKGDGVLDPSGTNNAFSVSGNLPLAAANPILAPNSVQGQATYDLNLNGAPSLESLSGTVRTNGARFSLPAIRAALSDINSTITLNNGTAGIAVTTNFSGGGDIAADGTVNLSPPYSANLPIRLNNLGYREGQLLDVVVDGAMLFSGPLTGGGTISGDLSLEKTDIQISSAALAGVGAVPEISHVAEPSRALRTRQRAGLIKEAEKESSSSNPFGLDINIQTARHIAVRGMGLNADFDGGVRLSGNTNEVVTQGELDLIRGRMDFLTKTFEIEEGTVRLAGELEPWMRVVAISEQPDATIRIILEGYLDDPKILLESDPELPEDEVLSQLLFGRDLSSISGLQAAQLAAALATLSGNGPRGPRLGEKAGLDELSLTFDEEGSPGLRAGKHISENLYTEFEVNSKGESGISLNLDVTNNLTVKGSVATNNNSAIGLFFQRDY